VADKPQGPKPGEHSTPVRAALQLKKQVHPVIGGTAPSNAGHAMGLLLALTYFPAQDNP